METNPGTATRPREMTDTLRRTTALDAAHEQTRSSTREVRQTSAATGPRPARFHLEVDGEVPADLLQVARQAVAEMNRLSAQAEARAAARQLFDAVSDVRRRGHRAWLVSA